MTNSQLEKRVLVTGGGTGGHIYPALAIIEVLKTMGDFEFLYVGGKQGIETRIVPAREIALETIWIAGLARSLTLKNVLFPIKLLVSLLQSWRIVRRFRPHVAIGTGGYVSGPILYVAAKMGVPVLIFDADAHPGVTSRLLAKYARRVCLGFDAARQFFSGNEAKLRFTGNPVRSHLLRDDRAALLRKWGLGEDRLTILVFGGSQGARAINQAMTDILPKLLNTHPVQFLWQTGAGEFEQFRESQQLPEHTVKMVPYIEEMSEAYTIADIIVCRAGATTLAELAIVAKPTILVPYPYSAGNHQVYNARTVMEAGAAFMVEQREGWEQSLLKHLEMLLKDKTVRERQSQSWKKLARPNAAQEIGEEIVHLILLTSE